MQQAQRPASRRSVGRTALLVAAVLGVGTLAGCAGGASASSAQPAPAPDLAAFVPANYRIVSSAPAPLGGPGESAYQVVITAGAGLDPSEPVEGGTQNVQVLAYDALAKRWNVAFDAASRVVSPQSPGAEDYTKEPLLAQDFAIDDVRANVVNFGGPTPALVIYGTQPRVSHVPGVLGIVEFSRGSGSLVFHDYMTGMPAPTVVGDPARQQLQITASWVPDTVGYCCPVRDFTRVVGLTEGPDASIAILSDDRPWLGAWTIGDGERSSTAQLVAGLAEASPASSVLKIGDRLLGVAGAPKRSKDGEALTFVEQLAQHRAGDRVTLQVDRGGRSLQLPVTMQSLKQSPGEMSAPASSILGIQTEGVSVDGVLISALYADSPAAQAGMGPGDVIVKIGTVPVRTLEDLFAALYDKAEHNLEVEVVRGDGTRAQMRVKPTWGNSESSVAPIPSAF